MGCVLKAVLQDAFFLKAHIQKNYVRSRCRRSIEKHRYASETSSVLRRHSQSSGIGPSPL